MHHELLLLLVLLLIGVVIKETTFFDVVVFVGLGFLHNLCIHMVVNLGMHASHARGSYHGGTRGSGEGEDRLRSIQVLYGVTQKYWSQELFDQREAVLVGNSFSSSFYGKKCSF